MTTSNVKPGDALATMRARYRAGTTNFPRLCLRHVRTVYDIPAKYLTAAEALKHVVNFHKFNGDPESIPYGAFVFSQRPDAGSDDAGHVFIAGGHAGTGKKRRRIFWTNDAVTLGGTSPVTLKFFTEKWGHKILGWSNNINGVSTDIQPVPAKRSAVAKTAAKKTVAKTAKKAVAKK